YAAYAQDSTHPTESLLKDPREYFDRIYRQYRLWLQSHSVQIIDFQPVHKKSAEALLSDYAGDLKDDDGSDQRDALIVATFLNTFTAAQAVMVCQEKKLIKI